jgi:uncharacterized SAM-binding protein YcdF (DUF218 family)
VYVYLSKILPLFVMPVSLVLFFLVATLILLRRGMKRTGSTLLVAAVLLLWLSSTSLVAGALFRALEGQYPPVPMAKVPSSDCIVVLGGGVGAAVAPRVDIELNEAIDRVFQASRLHRAGKGRFIVVSAGNQPWSQSPWAEADLIRDLLVEWGVPPDAIFLEGSSRNTRENAVYSKTLMDSINCQNALLVTSAAHMPRALAAFRAAGVSVVPVSTDVRVSNGDMPLFLALLPSAKALEMTSEALREYLGRLVYSLKGWN